MCAARHHALDRTSDWRFSRGGALPAGGVALRAAVTD
jgi:hypothetical protein